MYLNDLQGDIALERLATLERIPCCTMLIRVRQGEEQSEQMPTYFLGQYSNFMLPAPDILENELYLFRRGQVAETFQQKLPFLMEAYGPEPEERQEEQSPEEQVELIFQEVGKVSQKMIFDFTYFAKYQSKAGFSIKLDYFYLSRETGIPVVIMCINPPGAFFKENINPNGCYVFCQPDWNSPFDCVKFADDPVCVTHQGYEKNSHAIFSLFFVEFDRRNRPTIKNIGFSFLPLFAAEDYLNSGVYQLPVFKGNLDNETALRMQHNDPMQLLLEAAQVTSKSNRLNLLDSTSIVVRLKDNFLGEVFTKKLDFERIDTSLIPKHR